MFTDKFEGCMRTDFGDGVEVIATEEDAEIYELGVVLILSCVVADGWRYLLVCGPYLNL